jgi:YVTN family beta-propeller protein
MRTHYTTLLLALAAPLLLNAQKAYIPNGGDDLAIVDVATNTVTGTLTLPAGSGPAGVAFSLNGQRACIANYGGNTVSIVDVTNDAVLTTIPAGTSPQNAVFTADGSTLYVVSSGDNSVLVIDATTYTTEATITVGQFPIGIALTPDGSALYVANSAFGATTVSVISTATNTVTATITVGDTPTDIRLSPDGSLAYVSNNVSNTVSVINTATNTVTATIPVGSGPSNMAMHPDGSELYVSHSGDTFIAVVNTTTNAVVDSIVDVQFALGLAITPDGTTLYALTPFFGAAIVASTSSHEATSTISMAFPNAIGNFIGGVDLTTGISASAPVAIEAAVFPNPFIEQAILLTGEDLRSATITLTDAMGRIVHERNNVTGRQWTLDRNGLASGLYSVRIAQPGRPITALKVTME